MIDTCYVGDVRDGLRAFIAAGVRAQTCVTSPPFWGLRDYGTAEWEGGDHECDHFKLAGGTANQNLGKSAAASAANVERASVAYRDVCGKCGARRIDRQIGLEPTIGEYVQTMVEVFRLVRDVLADDGTLWLNLGDSYHTGAGSGFSAGGRGDKSAMNAGSYIAGPNRMPQDGLKPKDLCGIPWRVAFALQADGWYLRSDIIWSKPNPMPESVTDRPTKAHEYLFLLAKSDRYFYDAVAIAEANAEFTQNRAALGTQIGKGTKGLDPSRQDNNTLRAGPIVANGRNRRTVWTIATQPYSEAHFAVMPTALVEPCILAGSRVGDVVLDPFMGSGTVAKVAASLGRRWLGIELNPTYVAMQRDRTRQSGLALAAAD